MRSKLKSFLSFLNFIYHKYLPYELLSNLQNAIETKVGLYSGVNSQGQILIEKCKSKTFVIKN